MTKLSTYTTSNRAAWNASAYLHGQGDDWDNLMAQAATAGFSVLDETLKATLAALQPAGKRVVQIGCNNGRELLSTASLGAIPALGIDQSEEFLQQAKLLSDTAGIDCQFLCKDIYSLPTDTPSDFDLGLITIGVLSWMPDLQRFFDIVSNLLTPRACLVIYETHPILEIYEPSADDPHEPVHSYFTREPFVSNEAITYDGSPGGKSPASYWFAHTLGEIVTACATAGLSIKRLTEHPHSNREAEYDIYEGRTAQFPMSYTLVASKTDC